MSLIPRISVYSQSHSHVPECPEKLVQGLRRQHQDRLSWDNSILTLLVQMHMRTEILAGEDKVWKAGVPELLTTALRDHSSRERVNSSAHSSCTGPVTAMAAATLE